MDTPDITPTSASGDGSRAELARTESGPAPIGTLLDELVGLIRRYVVLTEQQADALVLWVAHTHAIDAAETTPYIQVTSAEKRSGKSRLLEVLELVVARPLSVVNISKPALFRSIRDDRPTLLLDEYDALFGSRARTDEDMRALLNAGHRRSATVIRCEGQNMTPQRWPVFCAKALAGIGGLPDTVADRSIPIVMKRKRAGEEADRFLRREVEPKAQALRERLELWARVPVTLDLLKKARPGFPAGLTDRAADGWEPLLAIADRARGGWPERARKAALALSTAQALMDSSPAIELLDAIKDVFTLYQVDTLFTHDLIKLLALAEESKYEHWWGAREAKPATGAANRLANKLRPFGIHSEDQRLGTVVRKATGERRSSTPGSGTSRRHRLQPPRSPTAFKQTRRSRPKRRPTTSR